jgi:tetratricopeptide (TPR) repeat protein
MQSMQNSKFSAIFEIKFPNFPVLLYISKQKTMETPKFLKKRWIRILITIFILLICVSTTVYYLTLPQDKVLYVFTIPLTFENTKLAIVLITNFLGLIAGIFVNIFSGDIHETLKEDKPDEKPEPQVIVPPIEIKNFISPQTETKQPENVPVPSSKFYPSLFIPDLKFFVGRRKLLKDIEKKLKSEHRASIHDISGLGKTYTTYKFAEEYQNNYDKIFFVRANKEEMTQSLAEIGVSLNPSLKDEQDQTKQAQGFKNWLEENEKWLVIYDNVDVPHELKSFVPVNKKGDCLFTSNFPAITNLGKEITIEKLDKTDARQLLFSRANDAPHSKIKFSSDENKKAFEKIIEEIDGHPLSLNTTGAYISENKISFAEFEGKLERTPNILLENEDGFDNYQRKSALKAFSIAIDDIAIKKPKDNLENSAELAQKLLFASGFLAPDNIPEILLQMILQKITEIDFESEENKDLWIEIRRKLLEYDLLKYDNKTFRTHRLIQKVFQIKQTVDEQKIIIPAVLRAIDVLFPVSEYGNWEECDLYLPHSVSAVKFAGDLNLSSEEIASNYATIGAHFRQRVQYQLAIEYLNKAIDEYQKLFGRENITLATCLNELASVFESQGKYNEAVELFKQVLVIDKKTIGKKHPRYGSHLNNLANVYESQGKYDEAVELYKQALEIGENTIGNEHPVYAIRLNNLAYTYYSQGKYDKTVELYRQVLAIDRKTIGKEHPEHATHLNNLANVYQSQGKYDEAIELYKQAIIIDEKTIGSEHPSYATRLNNLANVYQKQGKYREALDLFEEALRINEKTLPENHPYNISLKKRVAECREMLKLK